METFTISDRATAQIIRWYEAGAVYRGTFPKRKNDNIGLAYVRAVVNRRLLEAAKNGGPPTVELPSAESVIELQYGIQTTPWVLLRPDTQYIINPGAFRFERERGALVFGIQIKAEF